MSPLPLILSNVVLLFLLINLAKAFDMVEHSILVGRLRSIVVSEGSLAWFANYLSERVQCMKWQNGGRTECSSCGEVFEHSLKLRRGSSSCCSVGKSHGLVVDSTGGQSVECVWRSGVTWEILGRLNTRWPAAFWISCRDFKAQAGSPTNSELQ